jgi:hypothetical protein
MGEVSMIVKKAKNGEDFLSNAKLYVANMEGNKKTLHIKARCPHSKFLYSYVDFDTLQEAESFKPVLSKCEKCFPNQK